MVDTNIKTMTTRIDTSKFPRVKMEIVEFTTDRPKHGRRGSPAIPENTPLYAIKYAIGGYYTYSYMARIDAEECINNMKLQQTDNTFYHPWNVTYNIQDTLHVSPRKN